MFSACCRTVDIDGLNNVHTVSWSLYTATCQVVVLYAANVLALRSTVDTRRIVGKLQRNGRTCLVLLPLLGDDVLLVGHQLISDDAGAVIHRQPLGLHALQLTSSNGTVRCFVTARSVIRHTVGRETCLERAIAERRDGIGTTTLHIGIGCVLDIKSRWHLDSVEVILLSRSIIYNYSLIIFHLSLSS